MFTSSAYLVGRLLKCCLMPSMTSGVTSRLFLSRNRAMKAAQISCLVRFISCCCCPDMQPWESKLGTGEAVSIMAFARAWASSLLLKVLCEGMLMRVPQVTLGPPDWIGRTFVALSAKDQGEPRRILGRSVP